MGERIEIIEDLFGRTIVIHGCGLSVFHLERKSLAPGLFKEGLGDVIDLKPKVIIANDREKRAVTINTAAAEHLPDRNLAKRGKQFLDESLI